MHQELHIGSGLQSRSQHSNQMFLILLTDCIVMVISTRDAVPLGTAFFIGANFSSSIMSFFLGECTDSGESQDSFAKSPGSNHIMAQLGPPAA